MSLPGAKHCLTKRVVEKNIHFFVFFPCKTTNCFFYLNVLFLMILFYENLISFSQLCNKKTLNIVFLFSDLELASLIWAWKMSGKALFGLKTRIHCLQKQFHFTHKIQKKTVCRYLLQKILLLNILQTGLY